MRRISKLIESSKCSQLMNESFLKELTNCIQSHDKNKINIPSQYYAPSSLICMRQMYYKRKQYVQDKTTKSYQLIGMSDTGTKRHEFIQECLIEMKKLGYNWEYVNVEKYLKTQWEIGKCLSIEVKGKLGAETHLIDKDLNTSFRCDGIVQNLNNGEHILFEFKNQISLKVYKKSAIDDEHKNQVICYCTSLNLNKAFVVYENRDTCELICPETFVVTDEMKTNLITFIKKCENDYVFNNIIPPMHITDSPCKWCSYQLSCRKDG